MSPRRQTPAGDVVPGGSTRKDRPIAPDDPLGPDVLAESDARVAELDAIAWNLPRPASDATTRDGERSGAG
jgi:hypothetical protein